DNCIRWTDHLITGTDARRQQREMERGGARRSRHGVADADSLGEQLLEVSDSGTLTDPPAGQHLGDGSRFGSVKLRARERNLFGHGRHFLLSRGAPPPLADALPAARYRACGRAWPPALLTLSWGPTPTRPPHRGCRDGDPGSLMPCPLRAYRACGRAW